MEKLSFDESRHLYTLGDLILPSVTEICAQLTAGKYADNAVVAYAAARGTRVHELCALYDMDALPEEVEEECVGYVRAWAAFCRDYKPVWERIEWAGYSTDGFAGTVDRLGLIDGKRCVVDIKTAASLDRPAKIALCCQTAAYSVMAAEEGLHCTGDSLGVQIKKDGTYTIHSVSKIEDRYGFEALPLFYDLLRIHKVTKGEKYV